MIQFIVIPILLIVALVALAFNFKSICKFFGIVIKDSE